MCWLEGFSQWLIQVLYAHCSPFGALLNLLPFGMSCVLNRVSNRSGATWLAASDDCSTLAFFVLSNGVVYYNTLAIKKPTSTHLG